MEYLKEILNIKVECGKSAKKTVICIQEVVRVLNVDFLNYIEGAERFCFLTKHGSWNTEERLLPTLYSVIVP